MEVIHLKIINAINKIADIYSNESFDINEWYSYIESINSNLKQLCLDDMNEAISTGLVTFENDYLPILNTVINDDKNRNEVLTSFEIVTKNLEDKIISKFGKTIDVEIILYLGLCNGAGWVVTIDDKTYCLLGIEKIMELNWCDVNSMYGLIYHELGHVYHNQYGILERIFNNNRHQFSWQLFTEGIAMYFEQTLIGNYDYFHQDKNGWKEWCDKNISQIKIDFYNDLNDMIFENQRYFGDWVYYNEHNDVGYYLGAKFVQFICSKYQFDDILSFNIGLVEKLYLEFMEVGKLARFKKKNKEVLL